MKVIVITKKRDERIETQKEGGMLQRGVGGLWLVLGGSPSLSNSFKNFSYSWGLPCTYHSSHTHPSIELGRRGQMWLRCYPIISKTWGYGLESRVRTPSCVLREEIVCLFVCFPASIPPLLRWQNTFFLTELLLHLVSQFLMGHNPHISSPTTSVGMRSGLSPWIMRLIPSFSGLRNESRTPRLVWLKQSSESKCIISVRKSSFLAPQDLELHSAREWNGQ